MEMSTKERDELAEEIAEKVLLHIHSNHDSICPLGMTSDNVRAVQRTTKFMFWAGAIFAMTLVAAFASGFGWILWRGIQEAMKIR